MQANGHGSVSINGTLGNDTLHGGNHVADLYGWAGDDVLHGALRGGSISGGRGDDVVHSYGFGAARSEQFQTHAFGGSGDDTLYLHMSKHSDDAYTFRFGHHVFGGQGADRFVFTSLAGGKQRITGRLDDFDPTQDSIWLNDIRIDLSAPPKGVRIVEHLGQQWILIENRILYSLEGARTRSPTVKAEGRNSETLQEDHFVYWPEAWVHGVPATADVKFQNPFNFVPGRFLPREPQYENDLKALQRVYYGTRSTDSIEATDHRGQEIFGLDGNDAIYGNRGNDTLRGGNGNDYVDGYHGADGIFGDNGSDTIDGGKGHDRIWGGDGSDVIAAGSDNDTVRGGTGDDTVYGGSEEDLIFGEAGADILFGNPGHDTLSGQDGNDQLFGGSGNDTLYGGFGNDILKSGQGDDYVGGNNGNDTLYGEMGNDTIRGGEGDDLLFGGAGTDILRGGLGKDVIQGGRGADQLFGGPEADTFVFVSVGDSTAASSRDRIMDFQLKFDKIDLSEIDADVRTGGDQAFRFIGVGTFTGGGAELRYQHGNGNTLIFADINGDGRADFSIELIGQLNLLDRDFLL
jgi:Ca2+-binding RTX toxin-like protein